MEAFLKQYPKAIATACVAVIVYFLAGKIPEEILSPENITHLQNILTVILGGVFGRYIRLTTDKANLLNKILTENEKNQLS